MKAGARSRTPQPARSSAGNRRTDGNDAAGQKLGDLTFALSRQLGLIPQQALEAPGETVRQARQAKKLRGQQAWRRLEAMIEGEQESGQAAQELSQEQGIAQGIAANHRGLQVVQGVGGRAAGLVLKLDPEAVRQPAEALPKLAQPRPALEQDLPLGEAMEGAGPRIMGSPAVLGNAPELRMRTGSSPERKRSWGSDRPGIASKPGGDCKLRRRSSTPGSVPRRNTSSCRMK
jgi:hypothetical protein